MINVLKSVLQDGMEIEKVKEMANEYKVTLKYKGMTGNCSVSKMCSPGNEKSLCMKSVDTAISGMYINAGNLSEAKAWLDGKRWNIKKEYMARTIDLSEKELIYLHELLGYLEYHLAEHIFANSSEKDNIDIHAIGQKIFDKVDRALNKE